MTTFLVGPRLLGDIKETIAAVKGMPTSEGNATIAHRDVAFASHYLSRTTSSWSKGTAQTLTIYTGTPGSETPVTGATIVAFNKFVNVAAGKWVIVGRVNGTFYLISAECS